MKLNSRRIGEFTAVIRKADSENARKPLVPLPVVKPVKYRDYRGGIISVMNEGQHKLCIDEMDREEDFSTAGADNGIEFRDRETRIVLQEGSEIRIGSSDTIRQALSSLKWTGLERGDFLGKIDVPCGKSTGINETVDGPFADHERILVVLKDVMRGLPLPDQRGDDCFLQPLFVESCRMKM